MGNSYILSTLKNATILSSVLCAGAGTTFGQVADDTVTPLGRIILGTGGSETVAIDTPQAVSVLNQDDIDREQATTVGALFNQIPGVQAIGSGRVAGESFNIRGIGSLASSDESRIIITVDGAIKFYEQYRLGSFFSDPELYKQVEILRGPASSTLYGSGALGGVINFETRDASDFLTDNTQALRTRLSYSSNSNEVVGSVIYATKPAENFDTLVALNYRQADNYTDGDGTEIEGSEFDSISGLIKSNLRFGDNLEQSLTMSYTRWDSALDDTAYSQTGTSAFGTVDRDIVDDTLAIRYQNPVTGNPSFDLDVVLSYSNTEVAQENASFASSACTAASLFCDSDYGYETTSLKVENTASHSAGQIQSYLTMGTQLSHQERTADTEYGNLGYHPEGTDSRIGFYTQGEVILHDRLTIIPGIRSDFISLEGNENSTFDGFKEIAISPKLALLYSVSDAVNVFGSIAQTQRAPTIDEVFSSDDDEPNSPDLEMETADSAEIGASLSRHGLVSGADALEIKATLFYSQIDDLISRDRTSGTAYYENIDAATIYGVELEAAYEADLMFIRTAYSDVRGTDDDTGETLSSIPALSLNLMVGRRAPKWNLEYGWQGDFVDDIEYDDDDYSSYAVHDVFVDWSPQKGALQGIQVGFRVDNVVDAQYENSLAGDAGEGRSYALSFSKAFEF